MKVLHISQSDLDGGAAKAAYRLCIAQRYNQIWAELFVMRKFSDSSFVISGRSLLSLVAAKILPQLDRVLKKIFGVKGGHPWSFNLIPNPLLKVLSLSDYDLIHLHWVGKNMVNHAMINKITKPLVWTLHDSWPFTAGCHIPKECEGYKSGCKECPQISNRKATTALLDYMHRSKSKTYKERDIHFIAPSHWIANCAKNSQLLSDSSIHVIPNGICTKTFYPFSKTECIDLFGLPANKNIILFGAMYADTDHNKGLDLLLKALAILCSSDSEFSERSILVIFGASPSFVLRNLDIPVLCIGVIHEQSMLAKLYSAATVTLVPSRSESFGQVAAESLSCGTPVVAFRCSGLIDIVDHRINGYLANPYEPIDLASGIQFILNNKYDVEFKQNARDKAISKFDSKVVSMLHHELYKSITKHS